VWVSGGGAVAVQCSAVQCSAVQCTGPGVGRGAQGLYDALQTGHHAAPAGLARRLLAGVVLLELQPKDAGLLAGCLVVTSKSSSSSTPCPASTMLPDTSPRSNFTSYLCSWRRG
jgi:hypothetical protein